MGPVSSLTLTTCERGAEFGAHVGVFAGEIVESAPATHPPGTTVEVLFRQFLEGVFSDVRSDRICQLRTIRASH